MQRPLALGSQQRLITGGVFMVPSLLCLQTFVNKHVTFYETQEGMFFFSGLEQRGFVGLITKSLRNLCKIPFPVEFFVRHTFEDTSLDTSHKCQNDPKNTRHVPFII